MSGISTPNIPEVKHCGAKQPPQLSQKQLYYKCKDVVLKNHKVKEDVIVKNHNKFIEIADNLRRRARVKDYAFMSIAESIMIEYAVIKHESGLWVALVADKNQNIGLPTNLDTLISNVKEKYESFDHFTMLDTTR